MPRSDMEAFVRSILENEYGTSIEELAGTNQDDKTDVANIKYESEEVFNPPLPPPSLPIADSSSHHFSNVNDMIFDNSIGDIISGNIGIRNIDNSNDVNNVAHQIAETAFIQITQCSVEDAAFYLSACDYDLNAAVTMYMETPPESVTDTDTNTLPEPPVRQPLASLPAVNHYSHHHSVMTNADGVAATTHLSYRRFQRGMHDDDDDDYHDDDMDLDFTRPPRSPRVPKVDRYDAEGVRMPDDVVRRRLLSGMEHRNNDFFEKDEEEDGVEWMANCEPPKTLKFPGSFQGAKSLSLNDKKWLMVNIQNHEEFSSHMLNRDTWSNEMIDSMVRSSFTFWQRNHTSNEAQMFMNTYGLSIADLPLICIIDPRTSAKTLTLKGFVTPDDLCVALVEFLEENSLNSSAAVKVRGMSFDGVKSAAESGQVNRATSSSTVRDTNNSINSSAYTYSDSMSVNSSFQSLESSPLVSSKSQIVTSDSNNNDNGVVPGPPIEFRRINSKPSDSVHSGVDVLDYGNVPAEPISAADSISIAIKLLPPNKPIKRLYKKTDTARCLFAVVANHFPEAKSKPFDLCMNFPTRSLRADNYLDHTLGELNLDGYQVVFKWG